jgi:Putative Actinobacterial Holin-X, holin superfamily III
MASQLESEPEAGVATLVGGIVQDARDLLEEQMSLFQVEIKNHVHQTLTAFVPLGSGLAIALTALSLLGAGGAYFLSWQWPELPLWAGFTIMGAAVAIPGASLILWGKSMLAQISVTPDTALKGLKENLQWKTKK